ncbi:glutamate-rich protein 6B [Phyllobates terribilis]|uniref:glutamate-rich protein 6B n=1 Tax=Phyllobates terribilis TaxID=111132 RepID=UPI003CCABF15
MSSIKKSNQMANRSNGSMKEQAPRPSNLTVENVAKLELEYDSFDDERRKVEEYIKKNQQLEELKKNTGLSPLETQGKDLVECGTNTTLEDLGIYGDRHEAQNEFGTQQCRKENVKFEKRQIKNIRKIPCKNVQTQTESNGLHEAEACISKNAGDPEPDDSDTKISAPKATEQCSVTSENMVEGGTSDLEQDDTKIQRQLPLICEDDPLRIMEATVSICEFCHLPMKPFPSIEQLSSEPGSMLFCCMKIQELFQYMIMETIESYTPEKTEEETEDEQTPAPMSDEMKALCELRKQIKKKDTENYMTNLANHMSTYGSLFLMEKISFTLASANDAITNSALSDNAFSDQVNNIDNYFIPILDNEFIKRPKETIKQHYSSGQNFCTLFPDGTGQVLYPSGNIAILIACSKPTQFIFIILEDAEKKPQIQAIFMSNGHATCYHHNGMVWTVLNPWGGTYFDENGTQKKHWTWWDFSQHVHAPPFQPITCMLNSNIQVKVVKQDQVHLSFTKDKEKVTFNVGSKLLLKNPGRTSSMMPSASETVIHCSSKKLEIFRLLNKIRSLVRSSAMSKDGEEMIQGYIYQLQKIFKLIIALTNKNENTFILPNTMEIQESVTAVKKPCPNSDKNLASKTQKKNKLPKKKNCHISNPKDK